LLLKKNLGLKRLIETRSSASNASGYLRSIGLTGKGIAVSNDAQQRVQNHRLFAWQWLDGEWNYCEQ
jgi:hypothetical protein